MPKRIALLAGAGALALAVGLPALAQAQTQEYSWGNQETTYFYTPGTSAEFGQHRMPTYQYAPGPEGMGQDRDVTPGYAPGSAPPGSEGIYEEPGYHGPAYHDGAIRSQGSGMDDAVGR